MRDMLPATRCRLGRAAAAAGSLALALALPTAAHAGAPAPIWTSLYLGVHGGQSWNDVQSDRLTIVAGPGVTFGAHLGFNVVLNGLLLGVEADGSYAGAATRFATQAGWASGTTDWSGSTRARVGLALGPALLYATAGWSWTGTSLVERSANLTQWRSRATRNGAVYGLGIEAYLLPSISFRVEALRFNYGDDRLSLATAIANLNELATSDTVVRLGATVHFK